MTAIEHAILATILLAVFYYAGRFSGKKEKVEHIVEHTLDMLEKGNFVKVKYDKEKGEKELIPLDKYHGIW